MMIQKTDPDELIQWLDCFTGRCRDYNQDPKNYHVNAFIQSTDFNCEAKPKKKKNQMGNDYIQMAALSEGFIGNLCEDFETTLNSIASDIINKVTK